MTAIEPLSFDHVGIMVVDIDAAVAWYTQHLGLVVRDRWDNVEIGMKWAHLTTGDLTIEFVQRTGLSAAGTSAAGYHHLAISVRSAEDAARALQAAGATVVLETSYFERHDMDWAFVRDPFGNTIEVISYRTSE
jgi:catechol 2,3-dioxygenase-like lactoylglutathione lyase family enzyme